MSGVSRGYANWFDEISNVSGTVADGVKTAIDSAFSNVTSMLEGNKVSWKAWGVSVLQIIEKVALQMAVVSAMGGGSSSSGLFGSLAGGVASYFSGGAGGGSTPSGLYDSAAAGIKFNALGGVYDSPSLSAFSNGVYNSPQFFAFSQGAGVFAEAGPEAIMPLTRASDGSLGVRAVSSGVNTASASNTQLIIHAPVSISQEGFGGEVNNANTASTARQLEGIVQKTLTERLRKEISPGGILYRRT